MRLLHLLIWLFILTAAASAGSFEAGMDVDTYVDASLANESFSSHETLWATSEDGQPVRETYLGFINLFGSEGIFEPEQIKSASLALTATDVERPGKVVAYLVQGATLETLTWDDRPKYESDTSASITVEEEGRYQMDVRSLIQKAVEVCPEGCPYSIVLIAEGNASVGFASSETADGAPSLEYTT